MTAKKNTQPETTEPKTLLEAVAAKRVRLVRQRRNNTFRSLPYLAPGTPAREEAERVVARRAKGETVGTIATDLNLSGATIRRMTEALALAQQIEAGEHDGKFIQGEQRVVISVADTESR